jgi:glyoxylase-like metal-dependent hydrolase (beta-lactamase superfamily II)
MLRLAAATAGGALLPRGLSGILAGAAVPAYAEPPSAESADRLATFRALLANIPIEVEKLAKNITMLSGPGGNVVVLHGRDGKLVCDTFVSPAWPKLKETLGGLGKEPISLVVNTHWHFDHTDNNAALHAAGAAVLAHENTKKRMSEFHEDPLFDVKIPAWPPEALPQQTFPDSHTLQANGENVLLTHMPPAHTDGDVYIYYQNAGVLQVGDLLFTDMFPSIDPSTGGSIEGMISAANKLLTLVDNKTKIVPGHGGLAKKADLVRFRDMLLIAHDRVRKLKAAGKSLPECIADKPLADLEPIWNKGIVNGTMFVRIVYTTL